MLVQLHLQQLELSQLLSQEHPELVPMVHLELPVARGFSLLLWILCWQIELNISVGYQ